MGKHTSTDPNGFAYAATHEPFAPIYVGRHRAPEPGSVRYYAPARTMGTLAELVNDEPASMPFGPLEENRTSVIDITDRIVTHEFERPVVESLPNSGFTPAR